MEDLDHRINGKLHINQIQDIQHPIPIQSLIHNQHPQRPILQNPLPLLLLFNPLVSEFTFHFLHLMLRDLRLIVIQHIRGNQINEYAYKEEL